MIAGFRLRVFGATTPAVALAALFFGLLPRAFSQASANPRSLLRVRVTDPHALPVSRSKVALRPVLGGQVTEVPAAENGLAEFQALARGDYFVTVHAEGFAHSTQLVEWREQPLTVDVSLRVGGLQEQVVVTSGSRVEELQTDSPVKVEAVTREAMIATGYERLSDVLGEIPGVVTRSGSSGSVGVEQIHGINSRQVAVLQDGLPMIGARGIKSGNLNLNRQSTGRL